METINAEFHKGEAFAGMVDGNAFTVEDILPPGRYSSPTGGFWFEHEAQVVFRDRFNGKKTLCALSQARHLLLKKKEAVT